jgi:hypothetical protein
MDERRLTKGLMNADLDGNDGRPTQLLFERAQQFYEKSQVKSTQN